MSIRNPDFWMRAFRFLLLLACIDTPFVVAAHGRLALISLSVGVGLMIAMVAYGVTAIVMAGRAG